MAIEAKGYSIWLEPSGEYARQLKAIIEQLARRFSAPIFGPHITLLGGIKDTEEHIVRSTRKLAIDLRPFYISLGRQVICDDDWTRALAVRARKTDLLAEANVKAREMFGLQSPAKDAFDPHMSFLYTEGVSQPERVQASQLLFGRGVFGGGYNVTQLSLYRCHGSVEKWKRVDVFPLNP